MINPYLGQMINLEEESWYSRLKGTGYQKNDFKVIMNFSNKKAVLLARDEIISR